MGKKDDRDDVRITELLRTSQSWDGAEMPDYPIGRPELVAIRYVFPPGKKLGWHHHDVMNYGVVQQGELTIRSRRRGGRGDGGHHPSRREPRQCTGNS